jgi:hypothetical protein
LARRKFEKKLKLPAKGRYLRNRFREIKILPEHFSGLALALCKEKRERLAKGHYLRNRLRK